MDFLSFEQEIKIKFRVALFMSKHDFASFFIQLFSSPHILLNIQLAKIKQEKYMSNNKMHTYFLDN